MTGTNSHKQLRMTQMNPNLKAAMVGNSQVRKSSKAPNKQRIVQISLQEEESFRQKKMMQVPPVQNHRQSIRQSGSDDNSVEDDRIISQLNFSPALKK